MTDPGVDMFCAQICSVGIITDSGPVYHPKGVAESGGRAGWRSQLSSTGKKWRAKILAPLVPCGTYFSFSCTESKYLAFLSVLLTWTRDLPLVSDDSPVVCCSRSDPGFVIHRLLDRLPQCIDFCFPNLQERSKEKIKNTVSLKLNKNPAQGRYLREHGVKAEVHTSLYRFSPSLACDPIISVRQHQKC